jgi:hypothetical protein
MKIFGYKLSQHTGYISLIVLVLSLFFFIEVIAADIYLPIVSNEMTPTPTITSTPTLIPGGVVVPPNHSSFTTANNILHVVGEVQNNTIFTLRSVRITANFYNKSNQYLESHSELTFMNDLPPGAKTCFDLALDTPEGWTYYQFDPVTYQTDGEPLPKLTTFNVSSTYNSQTKDYRIAGYVRNDENVRVSEVRTIGTVYNLTGKVIGCNFHQVIGALDPGDDSLFEIYYRERDYIDAASYRVQVDGNLP